MNIISNQYLRDEKKGSAVYTIEIRNFLRKLSQCRVGSKVSTEMFYVNLSKFSIDLYIAGDREEDHLSVFLTHHSDWIVRARADVSVKHEVLRSTVKAGTVFQPQTMRLAESSLGWSKTKTKLRTLERDQEITAIKDRLCVTCNPNYIGRPRGLEQILDLLEPNVVIDG